MFDPPTAEVPFGELVGDLERAAHLVADRLDPDEVPGAAAAALYTRLDRVARIVTASRTVLARRVAEAKAWQGTAHQSAAEQLAALSGSSLGAAKEELKTSAALPNLPEVAEGLRTGDLSSAQGNVIADAAAVNPGAASKLIEGARRSNLNELRQQAGRAKAAADANPKARHARIHRERRCTRFTRSDGTWVLNAQGTAEDGAKIAAALDLLSDELFRANRGGERLSRDTRAFDALVLAAERSTEGSNESATDGRPKRANPRFLALLRVDAAALQRGAVVDGELCEITGVGTVPVETARALLGDAILKLVITNGVGVANVTHLGRGPSAAQKVALAWTSPTCTVEGCSRTHTEYDHRIDYRITRHTRLDELEPLCDGHHDKKTHQGWGLVPGIGKRAMVPPDDPRHPRHGPGWAHPPDRGKVDDVQDRRATVARRAAERLEALA